MNVQDLKHRKYWGESGKGPRVRNVVLMASEIAFCVDSMENDYKISIARHLMRWETGSAKACGSWNRVIVREVQLFSALLFQANIF